MDRRALGAGVGLLLSAWLHRLVWLHESPEPTGTDGYYYVVQVEDLLALGRPHVPDGSWVLRALAAVAGLVGEPILGVKVGASLLAALAAGLTFGVCRRLAPGRPMLSWGLGLWMAASPTLTQLAGDFPKNLGAAGALVVALGGLAVAAGGASAWGPTALAALLAATGHKAGAALLVLGVVGAAAGHRAGRGGPWSRATWGVGLAALGLLGGLFLSLPNLLHPTDLARITGQLTLTPGLPGRWPPWPYFELRPTHPLQRLELMAAWPALLVGLGVWGTAPGRRRAVGAFLAPLLVCLLPWWRTDTLDLGYRLALMMPLLTAPLLAASLGAAEAPVAAEPPPRASSPLRAAAMLLLVLTVPALGRTGIDPHDTPPYPRFRRLIAALPRPLPPLLITPPGMGFLYDHETGHEAMAWAPEPSLDRAGVWRVAWGIRDGEWLMLRSAHPALPAPLRLDPHHHYVREDAWEALRAQANGEDDDDLRGRMDDPRNPSQVRPEMLLRNRR